MLTLPPKVGRLLADLVDLQILRGLKGQTGMPAPLNAREALGATVCTALPASADAWRSVLRPIGLIPHITGSFSFGAPLAEYREGSAVRRCPIGDLMLVVDDLTGCAPDRRAVLLRSRLAPADESRLDTAQARLYAQWPPFRFVGDAFASRERDFKRSADCSAASAGCLAEVDLSFARLGWRVSDPMGGDGASVCGGIGALVAEMAQGLRGRRADPRGQDDWSVTIEELLRRTAAATVDGLGRQNKQRSVVVYRGACGSGLVTVDDPANLRIDRLLSSDPADQQSCAEAPISTVHLVFEANTAARTAASAVWAPMVGRA